MSNLQIIEEALLLTPQDKLDTNLNFIWEDESEKRLQSYKDNKTQTISFEEVFN